MLEVGESVDTGGENRLDVNDVVSVEAPDGAELEFRVVAMLEDKEDGTSYAVLVNESEEGEQSFIVSDPYGNLLDDEELAQDVLDDYLQFDEEIPENGEL